MELPSPDAAASQAPVPRFTSHARRLRERYGARVFRISVPLTREHAAPGGARDHIVRQMVHLNHHHGATRFHAVLDAGMLHKGMLHTGGTLDTGMLDTGAAGEIVQACLAPAPVVGLVLVIDPQHVSAALLDSLRAAASDHDMALELPLPPADAPANALTVAHDAFARAAACGRERSFPVTAVRLMGGIGDGTRQRREDAALLNRLRIRAVRIHPQHRPGKTPTAATEFPTADSYLAAVAELVEHLDPAVQIQGLGPAPLPEQPASGRPAPEHVVPGKPAGPDWMLTGEDFHARLEQTLTTRDSHQGCHAVQ